LACLLLLHPCPGAEKSAHSRIAAGAGANAQFKANIWSVGNDFTSGQKRPLVAVGYGPRCVPVMQVTEAAATICDTRSVRLRKNVTTATASPAAARQPMVNRRSREPVDFEVECFFK